MSQRSPKDKPKPIIDRDATRGLSRDQAASVDALREPEASPRPGLPAPESVISETEFTSPKGAKYRIIKTRETDPYDKPEKPKESRKRKKD